MSDLLPQPPSSSASAANDESESLDHLLDDALTDFKDAATIKKDSVTRSADAPPPPSDPLQTTFEAMCFNDEKFLNELDSIPNLLSNFPFGLGEATNENENESETNNIFNVFSQLGKHAELLQKIKDEDIEKALEKLADQPSTASASNAATSIPNEPHVEQLNLFMSSILSKDVMLPACQAVDESYDEWLEKNKDSLTDEELQRYTKQHQCVKDICREYETVSNDSQQIQHVLQKFQQLQTYGDPPKELLFFPGLPGFGGLVISTQQNVKSNLVYTWLCLSKILDDDDFKITPNIPVNAKWAQYGTTVAGGDGNGSVTNQLSWPKCLFMDNNQTMIIADSWNHRIIQWNAGDKNGQVVAGGKGQGNRLDQLSYPTEVLIDKETNSLIICDEGNGRVV
ncbi:unnamed protein product [Rotaria magnacalcarata]|uniref:Peroxin-19 n=1 Tax=Rotaria magnacalcarata TaxID=392030 RepID=A0A816R9W2_9BILA|nr:unnamed protein product [Rotaria magnacalcarata]